MLLLIPGPVTAADAVKTALAQDYASWDNTTEQPAFRVGCIGAITPGDMSRAVDAIDDARRERAIAA
jgi:aspartate aminotransferase-like enzyme